MQLTERQERIVALVKETGPITSEQIAERLGVHRATLRPDLAILTMTGILEARPRVGYYHRGKSAKVLIAEEIRRYKVKDIKSVPVVVKSGAALYDTIVTMFVEDVGSVFVVGDGGILEGVVSRKDLLKATLGQIDLRQMPVSVMMTRMPNLVVAFPEESVYEAAKKITEHEIDSLPVVRLLQGEKYEVIGRITKTNIARLFVEIGEAVV
ncbi:MAG: helix-turn-helix transcriptional regulator [Bacillota bacterium]